MLSAFRWDWICPAFWRPNQTPFWQPLNFLYGLLCFFFVFLVYYRTKTYSLHPPSRPPFWSTYIYVAWTCLCAIDEEGRRQWCSVSCMGFGFHSSIPFIPKPLCWSGDSPFTAYQSTIHQVPISLPPFLRKLMVNSIKKRLDLGEACYVAFL